MKATVWSKDSCPFCVQAKALLESRGIEFEERNVNKDWTKEQLLEAVPTEKGIQLIFTVFTGDPKQNITINKTAIAMICQTRDEVSDHYLEATTGLKAIRKPSIIMG